MHRIVEGILDGRGQALVHTGETPEDTRASNLERFTDPLEQGPIVVIATSCFGTGINASGVGWVVCLGGAWSILDLIQALGRGGREGIGADCTVLWYEQHERMLEAWSRQLEPQNEFHLERLRFTTPISTLDFFEDARSARCLRESIARVLDGHALSCLNSGGKLCSSCTQALSTAVSTSSRSLYQQAPSVAQTIFTASPVVGANAERCLSFAGLDDSFGGLEESFLDTSRSDALSEGGRGFRSGEDMQQGLRSLRKDGGKRFHAGINLPRSFDTRMIRGV